MFFPTGLDKRQAQCHTGVDFTVVFTVDMGVSARRKKERMNIKITSDSTCDLSGELLSRFGISLVPLLIRIGSETRLDGVDVTPADIFAHVAAGGDLCGTSAVSVGGYVDFFTPFAKEYDAVIHITLGSGFSSCCQNACIAADEFSNVFIVDSQNLSTGHGHVVLEAAEMAQAGMPPQAIVEALNELVPRVEASFILNQLDYMRKGGRCSAVAVLGANLMKLKPCIEVRGGKMTVVGKYRGSFESCVQKYVTDRLAHPDSILSKRIFITHSDAPPEAVQAARNAVQQCMHFDEVLETQAGCTVSCHCGPSTLGVLFIRKE